MAVIARPPVTALTILFTPLEWVQVITLSAVVIGLSLLIRKTRTIQWKDMLRSIGILFVPVVLVLTIRDVLHPMASTLLIGLVMAYLMAKVDTD